MTTNFELRDNFSITYQEQYIDLHNNFNFTGYEYNLAARQLTLKWTRSKGDWVPANEAAELFIIHSNVSFLNISYDNILYEFPEDDNCLSFVSYFPSSDRDSKNSFIEQVHPKAGDDILYSFETEHFIRVGCNKIELICR